MNSDYALVLKREGVQAWNKWRRTSALTPNLRRVNLSGRDLTEGQFSEVIFVSARLDSAVLVSANLMAADLTGASLTRARLSLADLNGAQLQGANLDEADLNGANLTGADLSEASLIQANLEGAILTGAYLKGTNLSGSRLRGADFSRSIFAKTVLGDLDLSETNGLHTCIHLNRSTLGIDSFYRSKGQIPASFLRGIGCPESLIRYDDRAAAVTSCFLSHSTHDEPCVRRIYTDLQANGVRCWIAQENLGIGSKIWDGIDSAIQDNDKVIVVLSESSLSSPWVEDEVNKAFAEERKRDRTILVPIRLDDSIMTCRRPWAAKIRETRNIGDFRNWMIDQQYRAAFERLLRDLALIVNSIEPHQPHEPAQGGDT